MLKKMRNYCKNKKGFTLVELIVVIVIILVLAAVLVPSVLKYVEKANKANCKADAATIMSQCQADYADAQLAGTAWPGADYKVGTVTVATTGTVSKTLARITITSTGTGEDAYSEITGLEYTNGKYTATFADGGWTVTKNS